MGPKKSDRSSNNSKKSSDHYTRTRISKSISPKTVGTQAEESISARGTQTKGVSVTSKSIDEYTPRGKGGKNPTSPNTDLEGVKEHLLKVIDLMEPNTPHFSNTMSEIESSLSTTSILASSVQVQTTHYKKRKAKEPVSKKSTEFQYVNPEFVLENESKDVSEWTESQCKEFVEGSPMALNENDISQISTIQDADPFPEDSIRSPPFDFPVPSGPCVCPFMGYPMPAQYGLRPKIAEHDSRIKKFKLQKFYHWITSKGMKQYSSGKIPVDLYKMNIRENTNDSSPPRQLVFDLVDELPKPETNTIGTNTRGVSIIREKSLSDSKIPTNNTPYVRSYQGISNQNYPEKSEEILNATNAKEYERTRVDIYYFDHGNSGYYRTTDQSPAILTEMLAERTEKYTAKFWAEVFGTIHIGFSFLTSFIVQLVKFLLTSLFRPLFVGILQIFSDYFCKPFLAVMFNSIIQPPLIFLYNVSTSIRDLLDPWAEGIGYFIREFAEFIRAFRLVEVINGNKSREKNRRERSEKDSSCNCSQDQKYIEVV